MHMKLPPIVKNLDFLDFFAVASKLAVQQKQSTSDEVLFLLSYISIDLF
jgi:hypothetical protein